MNAIPNKLVVLSENGQNDISIVGLPWTGTGVRLFGSDSLGYRASSAGSDGGREGTKSTLGR